MRPGFRLSEVTHVLVEPCLSNGPGLLGGSGSQIYGGLISGFNNFGSGVSGFANTGVLDVAVTSLVSGIANVGNNVSGLFFRGMT